jgi:hypothetical protein
MGIARLRDMDEHVNAGPAGQATRGDTGVDADLFRRILVPVDLSYESQRGLRLALRLRHQLGADAQVCVFALAEFDDHDDYRRNLGDGYNTQDLLEATAARLGRYVEAVQPGAGEELTLRVAIGRNLARQLKQVVDDWGATVVLAMNAAHGLWSHPTERLVDAVGVPVLLLPR